MSNNNIGIGINVLIKNKGDYNIGIGSDSLKNNSTGESNIVLGNDAGNKTISVSNNTYIGNSTDIETNQKKNLP